MSSDSASTSVVFTIGHSTHPVEEFIQMLEHNGVDLVADVRANPGSRRNPQFGPEALAASLDEAGIGYTHVAELGGRRYSRVDDETSNAGWRNHSFRSYADYMQTQPFTHGMDSLLDLARNHTVAIMCAEAVPWRCHRSLLGDALLVRGIDVTDIMSPAQTRPHSLTSFARVDGDRITYPPPAR
ncbi:DUF488 domain-containing protein [Agromyces aerolatus]|uniref:DUF488 domain-containing protein n=1 Tax=Agromyces sp. LY-1074 TaxID=3074080 RepID=UPI002854A0AB|nr:MULTISPECIES: DUF488 domain-containing protein [unclassified Agromyces]MDR5699092.1 DUF488 domain-containing protein [Agromyces sp. LY-1074]MDR5705130.1 DUF488 domain-containing protein [Agromyces sp. LY-1358]